LFDLDGTLTDPEEGIFKSIQYALGSFGIDLTDSNDLGKFIGPPLRQTFRDVCGFNNADTEIAMSKFRERYFDKGVYENVMYTGVDVMLKKLTDIGKMLLIATSKPAVLANTVLFHFNLDMYFTFVSGSELNGIRESKVEVIQYALEQNNITDLTSCIMIGDRKHDILGAKSIGIESIGVLYGHGDYDELFEAGADYIVKDIDELSELLQSI